MNLLSVSLQSRVIIGISAMVILFGSFIIAFIANQRKKLQYHKDLQAIHEEQQQALVLQNLQLEDRVKERTSELLKQKENLQYALSDLRASQLQLVQKEKMASLGEVASGIAHEIQNPLNFVNNFAEISSEMLEEIRGLLAPASTGEAANEEIKEMIDETIRNLHKINHHGKRAENIVKSMLQHAEKSGGTAELTDINLLAGEFLKLSYHAIRTKDSLFSASIETDFDKSLDRINIIPQDIGRVLMNIYNNAFYSTGEKLRKNKTGFTPVISVTTRKEAGRAIIKIRDNGLGIPQKYLGKIYQPFFTTKPAGEGTGLGLSLSYDIITAHRGELKVGSAEGEFAEFTIELPAG
jgi:two-component system, NtrC family, sensor kinase